MTVCRGCEQPLSGSERFCPRCGMPVVHGAELQRSLVTIVFCDVTDSTGLAERIDPEELRDLLAAHHERVREIVMRHGGQIEKYIGDGILAVFGVPRVAEDDALRAVMAADELRMIDGAVRVSVGVASGEVVTGPGRLLGVGDPFNTSARLEQHASSGEALLSDATFALVRGAVAVRPVTPFRAKGKRDALQAFRLVAVTGDLSAQRRLDLPLIGREHERRLLRGTFDRVVAGRAPEVVTILGEPGIGKSRLLLDLLAEVEGAATVLVARSKPFGEAAGRAPLESLLAPSEPHPASLEPPELHAAVRAHLGRLAGERPVVVGLDDLHWGDDLLLDLVGDLASALAHQPLLIVCAARPQLLERCPDWLSTVDRSTTIELGPLGGDESAALVSAVVGDDPIGDDARRRMLDSAAGNPLFLEQLATAVAAGERAIPPTLVALLRARLAALPPDQRALLELAAVEGRDFRLATLEALSETERARLDDLLARLVGQRLVRRVDGGFRFHHDLVRDSAYEAMTKRRRADLHERYAALAAVTEPEEPEVAGHHLALAARYLAEIGGDRARREALQARASDAYLAAGHRENELGDAARAHRFLADAVRLAGAPGTRLLTDLGIALRGIGDLPAARAALERAIEAAPDEDQSARARVELLSIHRAVGDLPDIAERARALVRDLEGSSDHLALALALQTLDNVDRSSVETLERALVHARAAGARRAEAEILIDIGWGLHWGWTPAPEGLTRVRSLLADPGLTRRARSGLQCVEGALLTTIGALDDAERVLVQALAEYRELGRDFGVDMVRDALAHTAFERGDYTRAEALFLDAIQDAAARGERRRPASWRVSVAECALGRHDPERALRELAAIDADVEPSSQLAVLSHALLFDGEVERALEAARAAAAGVAVHAYWHVGETRLALGRALVAAHDTTAGRAVLADAVAVYRRKQSLERPRARGEMLLDLVDSGAWDGDPRSLAAVV